MSTTEATEPLAAASAPRRQGSVSRGRVVLRVAAWLVGLGCVAAIVVYAVLHGAPPPAAPSGRRGAGPLAPVVAARARRADVRVYLDGIGTVTPLATVTVKSRVDGQLMRVHFEEGQSVEAGALLAEIDPRPF